LATAKDISSPEIWKRAAGSGCRPASALREFLRLGRRVIDDGFVLHKESM
jgi:hypothetical protein